MTVLLFCILFLLSVDRTSCELFVETVPFHRKICTVLRYYDKEDCVRVFGLYRAVLESWRTMDNE